MEINKYGVIMYKYTENLGDDIQTYAAYKLLPKVDYVIDRENITDFIPHSKEKIKVIMNGWFNHDKLKFLPSPYIYPLLISMHFSKNDLLLKPGYKFLEGPSKKLLKKYEPIGCRDKNTSDVLKQIGYKTYFSSCMTTTIKKEDIPDSEDNDYICVVDLNPKIIKSLKKKSKMK